MEAISARLAALQRRLRDLETAGPRILAPAPAAPLHVATAAAHVPPPAAPVALIPPARGALGEAGTDGIVGNNELFTRLGTPDGLAEHLLGPVGIRAQDLEECLARVEASTDETIINTIQSAPHRYALDSPIEHISQPLSALNATTTTNATAAAAAVAHTQSHDEAELSLTHDSVWRDVHYTHTDDSTAIKHTQSYECEGLTLTIEENKTSGEHQNEGDISALDLSFTSDAPLEPSLEASEIPEPNILPVAPTPIPPPALTGEEVIAAAGQAADGIERLLQMVNPQHPRPQQPRPPRRPAAAPPDLPDHVVQEGGEWRELHEDMLELNQLHADMVNDMRLEQEELNRLPPLDFIFDDPDDLHDDDVDNNPVDPLWAFHAPAAGAVDGVEGAGGGGAGVAAGGINPPPRRPAPLLAPIGAAAPAPVNNPQAQAQNRFDRDMQDLDQANRAVARDMLRERAAWDFNYENWIYAIIFIVIFLYITDLIPTFTGRYIIAYFGWDTILKEAVKEVVAAIIDEQQTSIKNTTPTPTTNTYNNNIHHTNTHERTLYNMRDSFLVFGQPLHFDLTPVTNDIYTLYNDGILMLYIESTIGYIFYCSIILCILFITFIRCINSFSRIINMMKNQVSISVYIYTVLCLVYCI